MEKPVLYHIRCKFKGSPLSIAFFNSVMKSLDTDWPYPASAATTKCEKCKGLPWRGPALNVDQLIALAKQCKVTLTVRDFLSEGVCNTRTAASVVLNLEEDEVATPPPGLTPAEAAVQAYIDSQDAMDPHWVS